MSPSNYEFGPLQYLFTYYSKAVMYPLVWAPLNLKIMAAMFRTMYRHNSISLVGIFIVLVGIGWHLKQRYSMLGIKDFKKAFPKRENCKLSEYNP